MRHIPVEISTTDFQFVHGRQPRGKGTWAFFIQGMGGDIFWVRETNYAEAKKKAIAKAKERAIAASQATAWIRVGA